MEKIKKQETSTFKDERLYYPQFSEAGIAQAIIRFLPNPVDGEIPFVSNFSHSIKGMGGWYIENCLLLLKNSAPYVKLILQYGTQILIRLEVVVEKNLTILIF